MTTQTQDLTKAHFHCIECDTLFEDNIGKSRDQTCPMCGNPPTGKNLADSETNTSIPLARHSSSQQNSPPLATRRTQLENLEIPPPPPKSEIRKGRPRTKSKEKKSNKIWILISAVCLFSLLAVYLLVKKYQPTDDPLVSTEDTVAKHQSMIAQAKEKKNKLAFRDALAPCQKVMTAYFSEPSAETKAQYVYQGSSLAGTMNRYYENYSGFSSAGFKISLVRGRLLNVRGKKMIGLLCENEKEERFEIILINDGKEWKIDWPSLIRYDTQPWEHFTSGNDGDEAEFRLYIRTRDTSKYLYEREMDVAFYKPDILIKNKLEDTASINAKVPVNSKLGRRLNKMFETEPEEDAYGLKIGDVDPAGFHRVRVKLRLHKPENEDAKIELVEILANHWYGVDMD